jgi:hypothetical protein
MEHFYIRWLHISITIIDGCIGIVFGRLFRILLFLPLAFGYMSKNCVFAWNLDGKRRFYGRWWKVE